VSEGFRGLTDLRIAYATSDDPLHSFYIPVLSLAKRLDRSAGYFTARSLALAAQGLAHFIANGGTMRLLVGATLAQADVEAVKKGADLSDVTRDRLVELFQEPEDEVARRRLEALAWMVATGTLEIKVGLPRDRRSGLPLAASDAVGYFHVKHGVATDQFGDKIAWSGSNNETAAGWVTNYEEFLVHRSWSSPDSSASVSWIERSFRRLWDNDHDDWITLPIPDAARQRLLDYRPDHAPERDPLERPPRPVLEVSDEERVIAAWLRDAPHLIGVGDRVTRTTAAIDPWPHQFRVANGVVETFPERYLLADEVGLGKTIEVGLALRDLLTTGVAERCLILAPKSVLVQWQDELREKFSLQIPIYDGQDLVWPRPRRLVERLHGRAPWDEAPTFLMSSQLAKRKERRAELLSAPDWHLVVVDEAHHARRKDFQDPARRRPNRLLELLEGVDGLPGLAYKTRGLLLLTATPMQVHPVEVWDLLVQLGMGGRWGASAMSFLRYFEELRKARSQWDRVDWRFVTAMARDELDHGGPVDARVASTIERQLGWAKWHQLHQLPYSEDPKAQALAFRDPNERAAVLRLFHHLTPLRRRMYRHTRNLLRRYRDAGLLPGKISDRDPEPRWVTMDGEERKLYDRVEEYISDFYKKYEGEQKGLGFVMTVYRRRLTSSFYALEQSLLRRLAFLRGETTDRGVTDEDVEEDELQLDVEELLEGEDRSLSAIFAEEIRYVEDFLGQLRNLGTDTKFDQLIQDLTKALARRDSVVLFTQYTDTMDYLRDKLRDVYGHRLACYSGRGGERWTGAGWAPVPKENIKQEFRRGEIQVLLGTEALAEGLNLQTCGVEINYDVPWNPMRLEQRIGRIDRIGQTFDVVWIWNYFFENTIEAKVYRRLSDRIDWFKGVVGPLQPILHRVGQTVRELALETKEERDRDFEKLLAELEAEIDRARQEGLALEDFVDHTPSATTEAPPVTVEQLQQFFTSSSVLGHRFRPHPEVADAFRVRWEGDDHEVTFRPEVADEYPETLRLLTFGDPLFQGLLEEIEEPRDPRFGLARVRSLQPGPTRTAWYRATEEGVVEIQALSSLLGSLQPRDADDELLREAEAAFLSLVHQELESEAEAEQRRHDERLSSLQQRGLRALARATYVWVTRNSSLPREGLPIPTSSTVQQMVADVKYPFAGLAVKVGTDIDSSGESPEWKDIRTKDDKQLQGIWQALEREAKQVLQQIMAADAGSTVSVESPAVELMVEAV
jgi:superfamily II DNA or RNA helicase